jgi:hypothetical protein
MRLVDELSPRDPDDAVAGGDERGVPAAIALERGAVAVVGEAVDLNDQPLCLPHRVDLSARDRRVRMRPREPGRADQSPEPAFPFGPRDLRLLDRGSSQCGPGRQLLWRHEAADDRLLDGSIELVWSEERSQVVKCPRGGGEGQAV